MLLPFNTCIYIQHQECFPDILCADLCVLLASNSVEQEVAQTQLFERFILVINAMTNSVRRKELIMSPRYFAGISK